jgi:hypothetical protein
MERDKNDDLNAVDGRHVEAGQPIETALQVARAGVQGSLSRNRRGSEYIQNLAIIGFFVIAVFAAIGFLAKSVSNKMKSQASAISAIPSGGGAPQ